METKIDLRYTSSGLQADDRRDQRLGGWCLAMRMNATFASPRRPRAWATPARDVGHRGCRAEATTGCFRATFRGEADALLTAEELQRTPRGAPHRSCPPGAAAQGLMPRARHSPSASRAITPSQSEPSKQGRYIGLKRALLRSPCALTTSSPTGTYRAKDKCRRINAKCSRRVCPPIFSEVNGVVAGATGCR